MQLSRAVCLMLFMALSNMAAADQPPEPIAPLTDRFFDNFIELYRVDPSAFERYSDGLHTISAEQMQRAITGLDTTHFTYLYPKTIRGHELPSLQGTAIKRLFLMAVRGGKLTPIPFQIDEFNHTNLIWLEGANKAAADGTPGVFDDFDELIFMFRDGGQKSYQPNHHGRPENQVLQKIRLDSP